MTIAQTNSGEETLKVVMYEQIFYFSSVFEKIKFSSERVWFGSV